MGKNCEDKWRTVLFCSIDHQGAESGRIIPSLIAQCWDAVEVKAKNINFYFYLV